MVLTKTRLLKHDIPVHRHYQVPLSHFGGFQSLRFLCGGLLILVDVSGRRRPRKKIFSPPPPIPQFAADILPAPRPLSLLETPLLGFSIKNRTPPPPWRLRLPLPPPRAEKKKKKNIYIYIYIKYPKRPPSY